MADDERVQEILRQLSQAIQETIATSPRVAASVDRMRESGYDLYLVLQANVALRRKQEELTAAVTPPAAMPSGDEVTGSVRDASFTGADLDFFRELHVRVD